MEYLYSSKYNSFFPTEFIESYIDSGWDLSDAVKVEESVMLVFSGQSPDGKIRTPGENGEPSWGDIPEKSVEDLAFEAEIIKKSLLDEVDSVTSDWRVELMLGDISDGDKSKLSAWMEYKKKINSIDASNPKDISYPDRPAS